MLGHPTAICNTTTDFEKYLVAGEIYDIYAIEQVRVEGKRLPETQFKVLTDAGLVLVPASQFDFIPYLNLADRVIRMDVIKTGKQTK